jgi:hypothetical protein
MKPGTRVSCAWLLLLLQSGFGLQMCLFFHKTCDAPHVTLVAESNDSCRGIWSLVRMSDVIIHGLALWPKPFEYASRRASGCCTAKTVHTSQFSGCPGNPLPCQTKVLGKSKCLQHGSAAVSMSQG